MFREVLLSLILATSLHGQISYPTGHYALLRERLTSRYLVPGDCHGCSLPASWYDSTKSQLVYEDETTRQLGWYLALLASEYHLQKSHQKETAKTEKELYFALRAINRLDGMAEYLQSVSPGSIVWDKPAGRYLRSGIAWLDTANANRNGYLIREDVPPGWHERFPGDLPVRHGDGFNNWIVQEQFYQSPHPASQDQIYHLLFGLAFVCKFIPDDLQVNQLFILKEARAIASRLAGVFTSDFQIRNPVTGTLLDNQEGGNGKIYSFFLAVSAQYLITGQEYPAFSASRDNWDSQNPWMNNTANTYQKLWRKFSGIMWSGISFASPNQIMGVLLLSISNALNDFPENQTMQLLNKVSSFINPEYLFFQNAYAVLHNLKYPYGYSRKQMQNMLLAMDSLGPIRYSDPQTCKLIRNKIWNRDCIFVQPRIAACTDRSFEGHFNGIDYMLFHNIYFIQYGDAHDSYLVPWADTSGMKITVAPNPVEGELTCTIDADKSETIQITLLDLSGKMIFQVPELAISQGVQDIPLNFSQLNNPGYYILRIESSSLTKKIPLIIY